MTSPCVAAFGSMDVPRPSSSRRPTPRLRSPSRPPSAEVMPGFEPETIVIVSFGIETDSGKNFMDAVKDQGFTIVDARKWLHRDPSVHVQYGENGTNPTTQRAVFAQDNFKQLMEELIDAVWSSGKIGVHCRKGVHRSDVAGRMLEDIANRIVDKTGRRIFNAKHFALSSVPFRMGPQLLEDARQWYKDPWALMPLVPSTQTTWYGYSAAMSSPAAWASWSGVHEYADKQYQQFDLEAWVTKGNDTADEDASAAAAATGAVMTSTETANEEDSPRNKRPRPPSHEPWQTLSRNIEVWRTTLEDEGVDRAATQELFLLAQHSDAGYQASNAIVAKLIKKRSEGFPVRKPSAFVHQCCCNARNAMQGGWGPRGSTDA